MGRTSSWKVRTQKWKDNTKLESLWCKRKKAQKWETVNIRCVWPQGMSTITVHLGAIPILLGHQIQHVITQPAFGAPLNVVPYGQRLAPARPKPHHPLAQEKKTKRVHLACQPSVFWHSATYESGSLPRQIKGLLLQLHLLSEKILIRKFYLFVLSEIFLYYLYIL